MTTTTVNQSARKIISIKGARVHNLKNISVDIPHNKLVVITGVSGSGKSSLAFDTIYAEGQRRYVESLSSYARQFLGKMHKPDVDFIHGIAPAVAIEQKVISRSSRSTVGTSTEIYDYLKLLFSRIGKTFSPVSGNLVKRNSVSDVVNYINGLEDETQVTLLAPIKATKNPHEQLDLLRKQGFSRVEIEGEIKKIDEVLKEVGNRQSAVGKKNKNKISGIFLVIDRFTIQKGNDENDSRIADSIQTAFYEGQGECIVKKAEVRGQMADGKENNKQQTPNDKRIFSNRFELDGLTFEEPSVHLFSFNNPIGACRTCEGFGSIIGLDENLIVPNQNLSIFDEAIACWKGEKMGKWREALVTNANKFDFPIHRPFNELSQKEKKLLWTGNEHFFGLTEFFRFIESESYKIQYRVMLSRYRGKTVCPECYGSRLRKESNYVKVAEKSIGEIVSMQIKDSLVFFRGLTPSPSPKEKGGNPLNENDFHVAKRLLIEITSRLQFLNNVGLGYLTLNRLSNTLSGGESQRINLATSLGSSLVGSMYILDEPSIGLHPRDTQRLIKVLKSLRDIGNSVMVVEHDEEIMQAADQIIDLGPGAGVNGGEVVFQGTIALTLKGEKIQSPLRDLGEGNTSLTLDYLTGKEQIELPKKRRKWKNYIEVLGAKENNLKNINVRFPLNVFTVVTGVSGSGKSSLVKKILYEELKKIKEGYIDHTGKKDVIKGDTHKITSVEIVDQNPIGKSSRSNPITYIKAYDDIRNLFASQSLAKSRNYKPSSFSFNVDGGRCETCEGEGEVTIEMQFMADVHLECEACKGKRFKDDVLEIRYKDKNIADVLDMTVDEALEYFIPRLSRSLSEPPQRGGLSHATLSPLGRVGEGFEEKISSKLKLLQDVGMGYIKLGQSSSTLSGGEAQRVKLATFLSMADNPAITPPPSGREHPPLNESIGGKRGAFFIFDEPTTGLHFHDIKKLLYALNRLVDEGNTLLVIEHNPDVIKCADYVIDLGPEGGDAGGNVIFEGSPDELIKCEGSITGSYLKKKFQ
ncbi:MAG: excinuclease ABC subunit UvrA [Bacteroidetes bacterium]|nr:excinuclease ABC subunit UvrA [Bacteroidota bacterium]